MKSDTKIRKKNSIHNFLEKMFVVMATIFVCLIFLEIGLRAFGRKPTNMADGIFEQSGDSYLLKKNITKVIKRPSSSYVTYTNSFGFRDSATGDRNLLEKPYFTFLGASQVFGNGVNYEQSFVGIFAGLAKNHGIEVLNLAVGGHYLYEQEELLINLAQSSPQKPSKVFICIVPKRLLDFDRENDNIFVKGGYLFKKKRWLIPYLKITASNRSSVYCFFRDNIRRLQVKLFNRYAGKIYNHLEVYSKKNRLVDPNLAKNLETHLNRFESYIYSLKATPIYVYLPIIDSYRLNDLMPKIGKNPENYDCAFFTKLMENHCEKHGIQFINLRTILKKHHDQGTQLRFKLDAHYNEHANRFVGEYLYNRIFAENRED
jgi:hypothetical protein